MTACPPEEMPPSSSPNFRKGSNSLQQKHVLAIRDVLLFARGLEIAGQVC